MTGWEGADGGRLGRGAEWYAGELGWKVFPCWGLDEQGRCRCGGAHDAPKDHGKHPHGGLLGAGGGMKHATSDVGVVREWWGSGDGEANLAVRCRESGFLVVDVDPRSGGHDSFYRLEELAEGEVPETVEALTGVYSTRGDVRRGRHLFYRVAAGEQLKGNLRGDGLGGIDVKHNGYVLVAPSRHQSGVVYEWVQGKAPWEREMSEAPEQLLAVLRKGGKRRGTGDGALGESWGWVGDLEWRGEKLDLDALLEEGVDDGERAVVLHRMACAIANRNGVDGFGKQQTETTMIRFNAEKVRPPLPLDGSGGLMGHVRNAIRFVEENPKEDAAWPGGRLDEWKELGAGVASGAVTIGSGGSGWEGVDPVKAAVEYTLPGGVGAGVPEVLPPNVDAVAEERGGRIGARSLSELGNGRRVVDYAGWRLRYTPELGWFIWNGEYWVPDATRTAIREVVKDLPTWIVSEVARADSDDAMEIIKWANRANVVAMRNNAISDAEADERILVGVDAWDSSDETLGVRNGVINLRTGALMRGKQDLYITKRANVAYTEGMRHPMWEAFLDEVTGGDKELQAWLQRAAGYTLTGLRTFDVLFLVHGPAGSGKSTFLEVLGHMLGDYMWVMSSSVLMDDGVIRGSDEYHWAALMGRRMVAISELPPGKRTKEDAIKRLTGDMKVNGRFPGERAFTFESKAKIWIGTNHRPPIEDNAMWRRIRAIPFNHVPERPNPDLKPFLMDPEGGLPAALAWAVDGAVRLLNSGERDPLGWCTAVKQSTDEYKLSEDRTGAFLEEETRESVGGSVRIRDLYMLYKIWVEARGERAMTTISFTRSLEERGLKVDGRGTRAALRDRAFLPRTVETPETNWGTLTHFVR